MLRRILSIFIVIFFLPQISFATVRISEIAWMGTIDSSSNEWIELYNDGNEPVSLLGYKLVSTDGGLNVILKGQIGAGEYYLIERTDDTSVPSVTADLIATFGSGLSNAGETLRITDESGALIDEVDGGTDWKNIGGSSETKNTPQWSVSKWITATATPRFATLSEEPILESTAGNTQNTQTTTTTSPSNTSSHSSSRKVDAPKIVRDSFRIVVKNEGNILKDAPETFTVKVYGLSDELLPNAKVIWNFGDGTTGEGKEVTHSFHFEGIYPLVVKATHNDVTTTLKTRIEVLGQKLKIVDAESGPEGFVKITSQNDTDISGWSIRSGGAMFIFPENTTLYAKTPITFANSITGIVDHFALALHRNDNRIISVFGDSETDTPIVYSNTTTYNSNSESKKISSEEIISTESTSSTSTLLAMASVSKKDGLPSWIYLAVLSFFATVIGVIIYASKVFNPNREIEDEAAKYTLVEIDSNLE